MRKAQIICGFPGVGKSTVANNRTLILDAESSAFSWKDEYDENRLLISRVRDPEFPTNYINFIKDNMERYHVILVSSHKSVRDALKKHGIQYVIVLPDYSCKNEYMIRYLQRGSSMDFIEELYNKWDDYLDDSCKADAPKIWLKEGQYLSDVLGAIAR